MNYETPRGALRKGRSDRDGGRPTRLDSRSGGLQPRTAGRDLSEMHRDREFRNSQQYNVINFNMTKDELILKRDIMQRVLFIYGLKSVPRVFLPKIAALSTLVAVTGFLVSVPNVLRNMPSLLELPKFFEFVTAAFVHTGFLVQTIVVIVLMVFFYILRDIIKTFLGKPQMLAQEIAA